MSDETNGNIAETTEENVPAAGGAAAAPAKPDRQKRGNAKPKAAATGALKAIGLAACRRHGLKTVWVTDDGQCFDQEGNARSHGKNLGNPEPLKVEA